MTVRKEEKLTIDEFRYEARILFGKVSAKLIELGQLLSRAKKELSSDDYDAAVEDLENLGFAKPEQKAAIEIARGNLNPDLFYIGTKVSQVLKLTQGDQARLASGERFGIKQRTGDPVFKVWREMTPQDRSQILSPEGFIKSVQEQEVRGLRGRDRRTTLYNEVRMVEDSLQFTNGNKHGEVTIGKLLADLTDKDLLRLVDFLNEELDGREVATEAVA